MNQFLRHDGKEFQQDEILAQFVDRVIGDNGGPALASDMDHTMFDKDLGILVFLEKLADPNFWNLGPHEFEKLLLPDLYRRLLERGKNNHVAHLKPEHCSLALDLVRDLSGLYNFIHRLKRNGRTPVGDSKHSTRNTIPTHVVQVFARKMLEFDRLFLIMDRYLTPHTSGQLLMRTRFFSGKDPEVVKELTRRVFGRTDTSVHPDLSLQMTSDHEDAVRNVHQKVSEQRIADVHGPSASLYHRIERVIHPVEGTRDLLRAMIQDLGVPGIVLTANLYSIAKTAFDSSQQDYRFLAQQPFHEANPRQDSYLIGTRLHRRTHGKDGQVILPNVEGLPVFGPQKVQEANAFATRRGRFLGAGFGDSVPTDGAFLSSTLEQGGFAFVVGRDFDKTKEKFGEVFNPLINTSREVAERIFYIVG